MIKLQRIQAQSTIEVVLSGDTALRLRPGESLLMNLSGVKTFRSGDDLVLLLPTGEWDTNGKPVTVRLVVSDFFNQSPATQVVITSDSEPVQMVTPESALPSLGSADAQAASSGSELLALLEAENNSVLLSDKPLQTQSSDLSLSALLAENPFATLDWHAQIASVQDASIALKLPGVNEPTAPVIQAFSSAFKDPNGTGVPAVNKRMAENGILVQGVADTNTTVTVVLQAKESQNSLTVSAKVDGAGKFAIPIPYNQTKGMAQGYYSLTAYSTDVLQARSPQSQAQTLFIDVIPPAKVEFDWNASAFNLNSGYFNKALLDDPTVPVLFKGTAEPLSLVKFTVLNKAGVTNPGVASDYLFQTQADGQWTWAFTHDMAQLLAIIDEKIKTQVLNIQVVAVDRLGNESNALVFGNVGLDLVSPQTPTLEVLLEKKTQSDGVEYLTLSRKSLDQSSIFKGDKFLEPDGKVNLKLVSVDDPSNVKTFNNITVLSDGSWAFKLNAGQLSGMTEGEFKVLVSVQGVDAAGNASIWSQGQAIYLDVEPPEAPSLITLPVLNFSVDVDGTSLPVANIAAVNDTQKKFAGTAEPGSTVTLTIYDAKVPPSLLIKTALANASDGSWSISLNQSEWAGLAEGVITCKVKSTDLSGNVSVDSTPERFYLDITPPVNPTIVLSDSVLQRVNSNKPSVRFFNLDDFQNGTVIQGTGEKNSKITLLINGTVIATDIVVDSSNRWRYTWVNSTQTNWVNLLPDGVLSIEAQSTDRSGNTSAKVQYTNVVVEKHTNRPASPTDFSLAPGEDTGRSADPSTLSDNKTNKPAPKLQWKIAQGLTTYIWNDANGNGVLDINEKSPNPVPITDITGQTQVLFQLQILEQGKQTYFVVTQDEWGNFSLPQTLSITLDSVISNPVFDGFQGDSNLSLQEFQDRANIKLSGTTNEDGCVVKIALFDSTGTNPLSSWVEVIAVNKTWSTANFFQSLNLTKNGSFILRFINTDEAGNSTEDTPLDVPMNIRSTPLPDITVARLSADTDSGNSRPNTSSDNITNVSQPVLTGLVPYDADADLIVRLFDSTGIQLVSDQNSPQIDSTGKFSFTLNPSWLSAGDATKFILKTYDRKTGTESGTSKEVTVTIDTTSDANAFSVDPVTDDNVVNYDEFNNANARPVIQGRSEVNSELTIVLSKTVGDQVISQTITSSQIVYSLGADGKEYWSTEFTQSMGNVLADGRIDIQVTAKDRAGNAYTHPPTFFDLKRGQLTAPVMLDLRQADDTGVSDADNITQGQAVLGNSAVRRITLTGNTNTTANVEVTVFNDKNKNGVWDAGDDELERFQHSGSGPFVRQYQLADGEYVLLNSIKDVSSGQSSAPSDKLTVVIDTQIAMPSDIVMGNNNQISLVEYVNSTFVISGKGEVNATVYIQLRSKLSPATDLLAQPWTAQVNTEGQWRLNLSKVQLDLLPEGELTALIYQKDRAGNVSQTSSNDLVYDKTPPDIPSPQQISSTISQFYSSQNLATPPWERPNQGVIWTDLYSYDSTTQVSTMRHVSVPVALPTSGSLLKVGDSVTLTWGNRTLDPVTVTAQDLSQGYVHVKVGGDIIDAVGKSDALPVKACFSDKLNNKSAEFLVLNTVKVSLELKSPSLDVSDSSQKNAGDVSGTDEVWYSNRVTQFKVKGVAEPGAVVKVYAKRSDGVGTEMVLATLTADSITGNYEKVVDMSSLLTLGFNYTLQAESTIGQLTSVRSNPEIINVKTTTVTAPVFDAQTLGGDGHVNSQERNSGVLISGNTAPGYGKIQLKLTNLSTNVEYYVPAFHANSQGKWSYTLGIIDWGVVGEGEIKVEARQSNLYGDISTYQAMPSTVKFDATVTEPLLNTVSGDNHINQLEYQASGSTVIPLSGKAEPGAVLTLKLVGANGHVYSPNTPPTVLADKTWVMNLNKTILDQLGPGKVTVELSQKDQAGNQSPVSQNSFFYLDLSADDLTLSAVTDDNQVNDIEKDQGVTLSGTAEAGAWVHITLRQTGKPDLVLPGFKANGSSWLYPLSKTSLSGYSDGVVNLQITQTDVAGNQSSIHGQFKLVSNEITEPTVITTWGSNPTITLADQLSNYLVQGTGPANAELNFQFVTADGKRVDMPTVAVDANGNWQWVLTPSQWSSVQGNTQLRYWSTRDGLSSSIKQLALVIDSNFPSPFVDEVGEDGNVSLPEIAALADETLVIKGSGELYSTVTVSFKGSNNLSLQPKDAVVSSTDKTWSVSLTKDELTLLTDQSGKVTLTLVQKDNNSNRTSVVVTKSFDVDMRPPPWPSISEQSDAKNYNTVASNNASNAADGTVTDADAKAGVDITVPIAKVNGNFVLSPGDSLKIVWGEQTLTKVLSQSDFLVGKNHVKVKVPLDVIAKEGENDNLTVSVVYTDKSGNSSPALALITGLKVTPPPPAPSIDIVSLDGFVNKKEMSDLLADSKGLVISGQSTNTSGKVNLVFTTLQDQINPIKTLNDISVQPNGKWSSSLSNDLLSKWADGQYVVFATFTVNGRTSVVSKSVFEIDKVLPDSPLAANVAAASIENALSELSGGLIRPWINGTGPNGTTADVDRYDAALVTEAAKDALVRVALPANARNGDFVVLTWGGTPPAGIDNTVTQALTNADIAKGYMSVRVPSSLMSLMGDFSGNQKLTVTAQFFDSAKNPGQSFEVIKGLDVDAVPLPVADVSTNFGDWLNLKTAKAGWKFLGSCAPNAEIEMTLQGSSGHTTPPIRLWKNNGVVQTTNGQWVISSGLGESLALALGEGLVLVSIIQRDVNGNPSEAFQTSFRIDLTPPVAPPIDSISKLTFSKYADGKTITGKVEKNAVVTVCYELLNDAGEPVFTTSKKTAMVVDDTWTDKFTKQSFDEFLTYLGTGKTGGKIRVNVYQTDLAGNDSTVSTQVFQFESQPLPAPTITSVSGLDFAGPTQDSVLSQLDFSGNSEITINGTTTVADSNVHLVLKKVNGLSLTWDIAVPANTSAWSKRIDINQLTTLGEGQYKLYVSTQVLNANGDIDNESLPKALAFQNNQDYFIIDTNGPVCQSMGISANGVNGNAKQGDVLQVVLNFSESIKVNTANVLPTVTLTGFSDGIDRDADFVIRDDVNNNNKSNQMVFAYTVAGNVNALSGNLSVKSVQWNSSVVTDLYDNPRSGTLPSSTEVHTVIIDTVPPNFTPAITQISGTDGNSAGGEYIIYKESGSVTVRVSLAGLSISELGTSLILKWKDTELSPYQIKTDDISNGWVDVAIDKSSLAGLDETISVTAKLWDVAGNASPEFSIDVKIDTIKPGAMTIEKWMADDLISAAEYSQLNDITGKGHEAGTTVTAKIYHLKNGNYLYSPDLPVTVNANGDWSISKTHVFNFLDTSIEYGAFELHVWQTDQRGNDSDKSIRSFFIDKDVPNKPLSIEITSANDGWLNANEVSRLELKVVFDTNHSPKSGDKLNLQFWKYTYKQTQRPANVAADFVLPTDLVITDADISAGYKLVTLTTPLLQQTDAQTPVQEIDFEIKFIDQGNNISMVQRTTAHLDTNIGMPVVDADPTTVVGGVTPTSAQSNQFFKGSGIELLVDPSPGQTQVLPNSTSLTVVFRSQYGHKITKNNVAYDGNGKFAQVLTPNEFVFLVGPGHTEAVVYYEVFQTDKAGNVSAKVVDSFNVALALSPPVLQSFTGDNIVNINELASAQKLAGITVPSATVTVKMFVKSSGNTPVQIGADKSVVSDSKGDWFVTFSTAELAALTQGQPANFSAYFEAVTSKAGQQSQVGRTDFQVVRSVPALSGNLVKFDANGDGANNDGLELSLTDNVLVRDVLADLKAKGNASGKWGKNFRVDAVDSVKVNGDMYAKTFRIFLGSDHSLTSANPIVLSRTSLINVANNLPAADLSLIPPNFFIPITLNMDVLKSGNNLINANELAQLTHFNLYMHDDRVGFKPSTSDTFTLFLDGVAVPGQTGRPLSSFGNSFNNTNWAIAPALLSVSMGNLSNANINLGSRQGNRTLTAQIHNPTNDAWGYFSVPHTFVVDTQVDTDVLQLTVDDTDGNGQVSQGDKIVIHFAEAVNLSVADLPTMLVNNVQQAVFGTNATLKAIGGVYTSVSQINNSAFSGKPQPEAQKIADQTMKSNVWEITIGSNPALTPGNSFQLANLMDNAGNVSSSFEVQTMVDLFNRPSSIMIDVVSKDNVISSADIMTPVNVSMKLAGAKVGDVVKLYLDGMESGNLLGTATVTAADVNANSVSIAVSADQWGGDGMRNLTATIQRGSGTAVTSDMRNVSVSVTADHWSATGKMIWFDTDNIVQATGTDVTSWQASVGGSTATSFLSSNIKAPMLVRNAVNGHNQLFFSGPDVSYDAVGRRWVIDAGNEGSRKGSFMYFNDPEQIFANYSKDVADVVPTKMSYTVIANGRKDWGFDGYHAMLTSIGANGANWNTGFNGADFKLATGNVGLMFWDTSGLEAYQGESQNGLTAWQTNRNNNNPAAYSWNMPHLKPGDIADVGFNPIRTQYRNGMVIPVNSGTLGAQLLLSHVYDATPYGNTSMGDLSFFSNSELIGHRVTDYKIVLGGGKPAGTLTYDSITNNQYQAIMATQFLIGAMNETNNSPTSLSDIEKNVNHLWRGMVGDIIWAAKAIKGAALQEINTYQAVKFGTMGYFVKPKSLGSTYDLSVSADKMNLLDDVLLLNQDAKAGNGAETVTVAGADYVTTGNANDTVILKDLNFRYLDGGKGFDTLMLHSSFSTKNTMVLSDYVSNSRGLSGRADDNARVDLNGYHKLAGFEKIDLSSNSSAQTLSVSDEDVWQLSDSRSLNIKMDNQDLLLTQNMGNRLQGHFYLSSDGNWYDGFYAPNTSAYAVTLYTQGGDKLSSLYSFDLSNNNKILDLNFDHALKINVGSSLQIGDFSVSGIGPYNFTAGGLNSTNPTTVSFNDLQQSLRFQSTDSINGPLLIRYTGTQLQDTQGRALPSHTWFIGSDLPNQDYDNYKILNANRLSVSDQRNGVMMLGGAGEDQLIGGLGADTLVGGIDSDTLTGGEGSDTFLFAKESGNVAGVTGDVIKDFNFGKGGGTQADTISLYQLFDQTLIAQLGKGAANDASKLANYVKLEWTKWDNNLQMVCSVDTTGAANFSKLFTMTDLISSIGNGNFDANKPDQSLLYGGESTSALLQKMLEEGRLVVQ